MVEMISKKTFMFLLKLNYEFAFILWEGVAVSEPKQTYMIVTYYFILAM